MKKLFILVLILGVIVLAIIGFENRWDERLFHK